MFLSSYIAMFLSAPLALKIPGYDEEILAPENIPSGVDAPGRIIENTFNLLVIAIIIVALIFTVYGGVLWVTSQGDKQKLDKARRTIVFAIIGMVLAILSFTIIQTLGFVLGVSFWEKIQYK